MNAQVTYTFKYQGEVQHISNCPATNLVNIDSQIICYRFCFSNLNHANNQLPAAKISPSRVLNGSKPITSICSAFALSMFNSLDNLKEKALSVLDSNPMFFKRVGDHYMVLSLTQDAGKHTIPNAHGHFDLYENSNFVLLDAVIEHKIVNND